MKTKIMLGLFALGTLSLSASNEQGRLIEKEISTAPPKEGVKIKYKITIRTIYSNNYAITHQTITVEFGNFLNNADVENYIEQLKLSNPDHMHNGTGQTTIYSYSVPAYSL